MVILKILEYYLHWLELGDLAPAIKVDGKIIVDGNHRYVAGRIAGQEPAQIPGALSPSQAAHIQSIKDLPIHLLDWGNR